MSKFLVETSARHVHLTEATFKALFGEEATLTVNHYIEGTTTPLACEERVTVVGPKKELAGVSILGPFRKADQVELSMTDARSLGLAGVIRESGDLANTPGCTLIGPKGQVTISEGVIVAKRHIHATTKDAAELGVTNGEIVNVKVETQGRTLIFGDVVVRVSDSYGLAMHIDTDESNAAACGREQYGEIVK